ncbi:DUF4230 domain-containing protein [Spirochaeta isovalerica]|uniref:DUF4230 domain-containing protein n=1 Tax=Spirochaeta isovalerica TaxID=150 RepID=A0A841RFT1_9SPIO|nr:hypothetical protein [Spirochaeta isovalerica]
MKFKAIVLPVLFTLILAAVTFLLTDRFVVGVSLPRFSLFSRKSESAYTVAEEIGDLYILNTTEYRLKLIFPYDFVDRDLSWWAVKEMYERGIEGDENQEELKRIYKACLDGGFDPAIDVYEFIILNAVVKAGINISGTVFENPSLYPEESLSSYMKVAGEGEKRVVDIHLPAAEITDLYIDDRKPSSDSFPDARITPARWRDLVDFLQPRIRDKVIELGILDDADKNNRELISKILKDSGFSEVNFRERKL